MNRRTLSILIVGLFALMASGVGVAMAQHGGERHSAEFLTHQKPSRVSSRLTGDFRVFRRAATTATGDASALNANISLVHAGANASLARLALTTPTGAHVYAVPSADGACVESDDLVISGCAPTSEVVSGDEFTATVCSPFMDPDKIEIAGLLPDGVSNVAFLLSNGKRSAVTPVNNVVFALINKSDPLPLRIVWTAADGEHTAATSVPPDAGHAQCDRSVDPRQALKEVRGDN